MRTMIVGADGQLGSDLCKVIDRSEQVPLTIKELDITNLSQVESVLAKHSPQVVINTAAYHRVDDCEDYPEKALGVNGIGARNLAKTCRGKNIDLVHISTDYVFDGSRQVPYSEDDFPNPCTAYGISKLTGELFVKYLMSNYYIIRTSGLYGKAGCLGKGGGNFVENMLKRAKAGEKIRVVDDEIIGPTYTFDLAEKIYELVKTKKYGLYHATNQGSCSWWGFADKIFKIAGIKVNIEKTSRKEYVTKAHRPQYSVLENRNLAKAGLGLLRNWDEALKAYLNS